MAEKAKIKRGREIEKMISSFVVLTIVLSVSAFSITAISAEVEIGQPKPVKDIIVTADPQSIPANGSSISTITATVIPNEGYSPGNLTVAFEITNQLGGASLTNSSALTNESGIATTKLKAGKKHGPVTINASCYEKENFTTIALTPPTVTINDTSAPPLGITNTPVMINVTDPTGLGAATINLTYNPNVCVVTNVVKGPSSFDSLTSSHPYTNTSGYVRMVASQTGATGVGPGLVNFANITLRAVGKGNEKTWLNLTVETLKNNSGISVPYTVCNGIFTVEDITPPSITDPRAEPPVIGNDGKTFTMLMINVTDESAIHNVTIDLTLIGGSAKKEMTKIEGTNVYTATTNASIGTTSGIYNLYVNATDIWGNYNNTVSIPLRIIEPIRIYIGDAQAPLGSSTTTSIMMNITDPTGLGAATINLTYNQSVCVVTNIVKGPSSFDTLTSSHPYTNTSGYVRMVASQTGATGVGPGLIKFADITLKAVGSFGKESRLNLSIETLKNNSGVSVPYTVTNGTFKIGVKGDYSGDGVKDAWDCTYLARHLAGIPGYGTIYAGDVSGDGIVDSWDCTYLARHLAGIPGYEDP